MTMSLRLIAAVAALCLSMAVSAQVPINDRTINHWLDSLDAMNSWSKSNPEKQAMLDEMDEQMDAQGPDSFSADMMIQQMKAAGVYQEAIGILRKHGFDSPDLWADYHMRLIKAVMSLQMDSHQMGSQMQAQMDEIRNSPSLSEEQKAQMMAMMESTMGMMKPMFQAPEADRQAVKPHVDRIMERLDRMGD